MAELTPQEQAVLAMVTANPLIGQQEIAAALGLARSTVAAHIVQLVQKGHVLGRGYILPRGQRVVCVGGAVLDRKYRARAQLVPGTSNPVDGHRSFGGVARNVAENLARLEADVGFVSIVGEDEAGRALTAALRDLGVDVSQVIATPERPTAEYAAVLDPDNDLYLGIADMEIFDLMTPERLDRFWPHLASAIWVFVDCNMPAPMIEAIITRRAGGRFRLAVDTVSAPKAARLPRDLSGIDLLFTNHDEAGAVLRRGPGDRPDAMDAAAALRDAGAGEVVVTQGAKGYVVASADALISMPPVPASPLDITGAGDAMIAGTLFRLLAGAPLPEAARTGALLATLTTESTSSVHPELSSHFLASHQSRIHA